MPTNSDVSPEERDEEHRELVRGLSDTAEAERDARKAYYLAVADWSASGENEELRTEANRLGEAAAVAEQRHDEAINAAQDMLLCAPRSARTPLILLTEACARARLDYERCWRAVVGGRVPAERRGRSWYVDPADLTRVINSSSRAEEGPVSLATWARKHRVSYNRALSWAIQGSIDAHKLDGHWYIGAEAPPAAIAGGASA